MTKYNIAVVGATGNVGRRILSILDERNFPVGNIYALASSASNGKQISFGEKDILTVKPLDSFDFSLVDIVFSCVDSKIVKSFASRATEKGAIIIDKSSYFRMSPDVDLIVPEVNEHLIKQGTQIFASPNCCVIPLVLALKPLHDAYKIKRIIVSTYQSVSGAGKDYMDELYNQTKSTYTPDKMPAKLFEKQIAFNLIPKIDKFAEDHSTLEEQKVCEETRKILGSDIKITATCVRVPVFVCHSLSVNVEFEKKIDLIEAGEILEESDGLALIREDSKLSFMTPQEAAGEDLVYISRMRQDFSCENGLNMWITCDNMRKGAALNAVQIAETISRIK